MLDFCAWYGLYGADNMNTIYVNVSDDETGIYGDELPPDMSVLNMEEIEDPYKLYYMVEW